MRDLLSRVQLFRFASLDDDSLGVGSTIFCLLPQSVFYSLELLVGSARTGVSLGGSAWGARRHGDLRRLLFVE